MPNHIALPIERGHAASAGLAIEGGNQIPKNRDTPRHPIENFRGAWEVNPSFPRVENESDFAHGWALKSPQQKLLGLDGAERHPQDI